MRQEMENELRELSKKLLLEKSQVEKLLKQAN